MGRDPRKTETITIHCTPELKARWAAYKVSYDGNPEALASLLEIVENNPDLLSGYFE